MSIHSFSVNVGQTAVPITPIGPGTFMITVEAYDTQIMVGGPSVSVEFGYPIRYGTDYRFKLEADDQVFGVSMPGEPDTTVYVLVDPGII